MGNYQDLEIIAVNDLTLAGNLAYLMRYDSDHGKPPFAVKKPKIICGFNNFINLLWAQLIICGDCLKIFSSTPHLNAGCL